MEKAIETLKKFREGMNGMSGENYEDGIFLEGKVAGLELAITLLEEVTKLNDGNN